MRANSNFVRQFNLIWVVQSSSQKYSALLVSTCRVPWQPAVEVDGTQSGRNAMLRYGLIILSAVVLVCATLVPDDALARGGRGGGFSRGGGGGGAAFRGGGGGARVAHRGYAGRGYAGRGYAGRGYAGRGYAGRAYAGRVARPVNPIAGRPIAGLPGRPGYPGYGGGWGGGYYPYRGVAAGVAAGAVAAGAYGYYNNYNSGCYYDASGQWICPQQYGYYPNQYRW